MDDRYIALTNNVLNVNYWGEVLAVELLAHLLSGRPTDDFTRLITRQLMDETRHANVTRALLLDRGTDPIRQGGPEEFTYNRLFTQWRGRSVEEVLLFIGTNERVATRNFSSLIRVGRHEGDDALVGLYSEILNDEVKHTHDVFDTVPETAANAAAITEAETDLSGAFSRRYMELGAAYRSAFTRDRR